MSENNENIAAAADAKLDGRAEVFAEDGAKYATLILHGPVNGGVPITFEGVMAALKTAGIVFGVDSAAVKKAVDSKAYEMPVTVAKAVYPKRGANGFITFKFDKDHKLKPHQNEFGIADYRELNSIVPIKKNEIIADIILPEKGTPGTNVLGKEIPGEDGVPAKFQLGKNTLVTLDGKNIVAACDGHIIYGNNCFIVEEAVTIKTDLDISVGNISFFGDVHIKGNVMEGFSINAGKNVKIDGSVFGGEINAGGNVAIVGGCINSKINCDGNADIGFCENSSIFVKGDLTSKQYAFCDVFCYGGVTAKGTHGVIAGGKIVSMHDVKAGIIGNTKYTPTEINIGDGSVLYARKREAEVDLNESERIFDMTIKNLAFLKSRKDAQGGVLTEEQQRVYRMETQNKLFYSLRKTELQALISRLEEDIMKKDNLSATVGVVFPGVKFCINFLTLDVVDLAERCRVLIVGDKLEIVPV